MWLHNAQTHGSSCTRKVRKRRREGKKQEKGKVTRKRDLQRKVQRRQKDESEKEKGVERGLKALKNFALPAQQMPYSAWQSDLWLGSIYTLSVTSGPAQVRNACVQHSCNEAG